MNHPVIREVVCPEADYFATSPYTEEYTFDGHAASLTFWHRPLHAMTEEFTRAGFAISVISEPPFSPETPRELLPPDLGGPHVVPLLPLLRARGLAGPVSRHLMQYADQKLT